MADKQDPANPNAQPQTSLPPVDPRILVAMYDMAQDDEIDLLEYMQVAGFGVRRL